MGQTESLMAGKKGVILGVANDKSIAWGIAKAVADAGAELAFTFQGEALERRVRPLANSLGSKIVVPCDVTDEASMDAVFDTLKSEFGQLDFMVHAVAFSDKDELKGQYLQTSRGNFLRTMDISCYSLTALCQRAAPLMTAGGSVLTLTYYGAERVMPHYNVMGVAKAALEASVRYLAAKGVDVPATGGTNWQRFLPPRFQRIIAFPSIWTEEEKANWGKSWVDEQLFNLKS